MFANADDKVVNFDMTRPEYLDKMSPEDRKALEEYKKKNAEIVAGNAKIQNLNALLTQARADNKAGNYDAAMTAMQQATAAKPDEGILWITLGDAQLGSRRRSRKGSQGSGNLGERSGDHAEVHRCCGLLQEGHRPERGLEEAEP